MFGFGKVKNNMGRQFTCAVIPAAGESRRMGGENKLLLELDGIPVLVRTIFAFERCASIDKIIITCREQDIVPYGRLLRAYGLQKVSNIVRGGESRLESVFAGVSACPEQTTLVAIHDGARPLVSQEIIEKTVQAAAEYGAAAPIIPLKDSIKRVTDGKIVADVPRDDVAAVQTPQVFAYASIMQALEEAVRTGRTVTDDCAALEPLGKTVHAVTGSYENIKITTPEDLAIGKAILGRREDG